jgi:hypothetical protein
LEYIYFKMKKNPPCPLPRARGAQASRVRQRTYALAEPYQIPDDLLPGSLVRSETRCGKPTCHCAEGAGHPAWSLTFMLKGHKRVERIPAAWAEAVQRQVQAGRAFQDAVREVLAANAQLLVLARQQQRARARRP